MDDSRITRRLLRGVISRLLREARARRNVFEVDAGVGGIPSGSGRRRLSPTSPPMGVRGAPLTAADRPRVTWQGAPAGTAACWHVNVIPRHVGLGRRRGDGGIVIVDDDVDMLLGRLLPLLDGSAAAGDVPADVVITGLYDGDIGCSNVVNTAGWLGWLETL